MKYAVLLRSTKDEGAERDGYEVASGKIFDQLEPARERAETIAQSREPYLAVLLGDGRSPYVAGFVACSLYLHFAYGFGAIEQHEAAQVTARMDAYWERMTEEQRTMAEELGGVRKIGRRRGSA